MATNLPKRKKRTSKCQNGCLFRKIKHTIEVEDHFFSSDSHIIKMQMEIQDCCCIIMLMPEKLEVTA